MKINQYSLSNLSGKTEPPQNIANVEYLVKTFPESYLAEYGKLNLGYLYLAKASFGSIERNNTDKVLYYLRSSKKYGIPLLTTQNIRIIDKANSLFQQLLEVAARAYDYNVPADIEKEFTFPFKH